MTTDGGTAQGDDGWDAWRAEDDDVDIFVFAADDASLTPAAAPDDASRSEPPPEVDSDWNDTSWLQELDGAARGVAPAAAPPPPAARTDVSDEQLDEAVQVLADASGAAPAHESPDADVAELLRELSLLSIDD